LGAGSGALLSAAYVGASGRIGKYLESPSKLAAGPRRPRAKATARRTRRSEGHPAERFSFLLTGGKPICYILNHMVQYSETRLDASFAALSDATRRGVLEQLGRADASITDLAGKFHMTLTGMKKHVRVLERAALVTTEKAGRVRTCRLGKRALEKEAAWIKRHRQLWSARFDALDKIVEHLKRKEKADARRKRR